MASQADRADKYQLYEAAVQCVEAEIDFVDATFKSVRGYRASLLREDFCGTAQTSVEWIKRRVGNYSIGVDLDAPVLAWSQSNHIDGLDQQTRSRITLLQADVRRVEVEPVQIILAMNFSYQLFQTRDSLRSYFKAARAGLSDDGVLFIDAYGGYEAYREITEETQCELEGSPFTYVWEQARYNPINGDMQCYIHFDFADGSRMDKAFSYRWRLWTLPELQELLLEAGFDHAQVYWEGTDTATGEGNGEYTHSEQGDADASWICYLSAHNN